MFNYHFDWAIITSGQYFEWLVSGLKITIELSIVSIALSFILGLLIAVMRMSQFGPIRWFAHGYLEFFRNTPLLVQIFFWYFGSYQVLPISVQDWMNERNFEFISAVIALTIYTSAFIAEDIRSGVRSIPKEQMEAARSLGMNYFQSMRLIVLPQAIRVIMPPVGNEFITLLKDSSLVSAVAVADMTRRGREFMSTNFNPIQTWMMVALLYLVLTVLRRSANTRPPFMKLSWP